MPPVNLSFTEKSIDSMELGMLFVSKLDKRIASNLVYSEQERTLVHVPVCKNCFKTFSNHSGLGGHLRVCAKKDTN